MIDVVKLQNLVLDLTEKEMKTAKEKNIDAYD